jgi:type IV pilus assembly protein PilV
MTGFTLLEVLVALVVLSVGLLGLSGLQATSLRNNHSAFLRSQATLLKTDIIDRMRANRDSAAAGSYDILYDQTPTPVSCVGSCSASQVAQLDLLEWRAYVERLPGGESEVSVDADGVAEVKVCWSDTRDSSAACSDAETTKLELVSKVQL